MKYETRLHIIKKPKHVKKFPLNKKDSTRVPAVSINQIQVDPFFLTGPEILIHIYIFFLEV